MQSMSWDDYGYGGGGGGGRARVVRQRRGSNDYRATGGNRVYVGNLDFG